MNSGYKILKNLMIINGLTRTVIGQTKTSDATEFKSFKH